MCNASTIDKENVTVELLQFQWRMDDLHDESDRAPSSRALLQSICTLTSVFYHTQPCARVSVVMRVVIEMVLHPFELISTANGRFTR